MTSRQQIFKNNMLHGKDHNNDDILLWCVGSNVDKYKARCLICVEDFDVKNRGHDDIIRHSKKNIHIKKLQKIQG